MSVCIAGIGTWVPERVRTNDEWPSAFTGHHAEAERTFNDIPASEDPVAAGIMALDLEREADDPFLGATRRHVADDSLSSTESEVYAAIAALKDAGVGPGDVDLVLSYSMVPDQVSPPSGGLVAHALGATSAMAPGIEAACATAIIQMELACAMLESGRAKVALLTQSHLIWRALAMMHPASPGLGDASTAIVLTRGDRGLVLRSTYAVTHGEFTPAVLWVRGRKPAEDTPWWKPGGDSRVGTRSLPGVKYLMRETVSFGARTVREAAARATIDVERVDVLASVQPRGFIPGAIAQHLGLGRSSAVTTYDEIAHVGACGPVFNLARARTEGRLERGSVAALYGQGAGFTRAAAMIEVR
jgi:3-oxoacyl-[acyl-carrier-protein] synthase-3